ncbi:Hypothetical predicted protein [Paramuricea clavata]|uniref:Uncharacterized protein n=1 Tax=Paramuricea clavata TaxID=317549 RepID=A0A7D9HVN6_PARCT|nr:Hypothetical predicted protein [Paramuricea clavata]
MQLPYLGPLTTVPTPDVELDNTEIPVKLGLRFAIESRRFANGLDIPEIETKPMPSKEENSNELLTANQDLEDLIQELKKEKFGLEAMLNKHKCLLHTAVEETREY